MSNPTPEHVPAYCVHKRSKRAYVILDGRPHALGKAHTDESRISYSRKLNEWFARGKQPPTNPVGPDGQRITIDVIVERFWTHCQAYYRTPDGEPAAEADNFRQPLRFLRRLYGDTVAAVFGPLALKAVREVMVRPSEFAHPVTGRTVHHAGWSRTYANQQISRLKRIFKWAVAEEPIPGSVFEALKAVAGIRRGRAGSGRETEEFDLCLNRWLLRCYLACPPPFLQWSNWNC
jgi:hypothetical protein